MGAMDKDKRITLRRRHALAALAVGLSALALGGCATMGERRDAIVLDGVVVDGQRVARADEAGLVQIHRNGTPIAGVAQTVLQPGDEVATGPRAEALIRFPSGSKVFMRPNTRGRIGSFIDMIGEVFVKIRGAFAVQTTFVKAGAEGTEYLVRAKTGGDYAVIVFDGSVRLSSLTDAWQPISLHPGEMSAGRPQRAPRATQATAAQMELTRAWVERMERLVPEPPKASILGPSLAIAGLVAAIVAVAVIADDDDDPHVSISAPRRPRGASPPPPTVRMPNSTSRGGNQPPK